MEILGLDDYLKKISKIEKITEDKVFLKQLASSINSKFKENISKGLDADRVDFKPLSEYTKNKKGRGGESSIPLNDKGFLLGGMHEMITSSGLKFINQMDYALYHQEGKGHLPMRKIYPTEITDYIINDFEKALDYHINKILKGV